MVECVVEFEYIAEQPDELTIKVGQIIKNVVTEDGGWWEGELDGRKGMFPDNFVKIIDKTPKDKPPAEKKEEPKKDLKTQQRSSVRDLASKIKDGIPVAGSQKKRDSHQPVLKRAKVLFSYEPDNDDELKLEVDDVVDVFKQEEEGWWEGSLNGKVGVFPSNFVQVVEDFENAPKTEPIPEEKPKEPPQAEPKTKKIVGGVGLGNIFDGGPIKLRSATGSKKQPETDTKPEEPPSHPPASVPKKEKHEDPVLTLTPSEHATYLNIDERSQSLSSDLSGNFLSDIFDKDNIYFDLPELSGNDLNMLQNSDKILKMSALDLEPNICVVDIHDSYVKGVNSQVHPELDSLLKKRSVPDGVDEDSLIEYADVELEMQQERLKKYNDILRGFTMTHFSSKTDVMNSNNNNNLKDGMAFDRKETKSLDKTSKTRTYKTMQATTSETKKKKTLIEKINQNFFGKKSKIEKDSATAFHNKVSPLKSIEDHKEIEEQLVKDSEDYNEIKRKIDLYTVDDFTTNPKSQSLKNLPEIKMRQSIEDVTAEDLEKLTVLKLHQSAPGNRQEGKNYRLDRDDVNRPRQKDNYLTTLNETGSLSPFMKAIANKYNLFDIKDVKPGDKEKREKKKSTSSHKRHSNKVTGPDDDQEENAYVSTMFGESLPETDKSLSPCSRKRKSPVPKSEPIPKKRQMQHKFGKPENTSSEEILPERDLIDSYVDNVLKNIVKELDSISLGKSIYSQDKTDNSLFSHHKEEFEQIRAMFESGAVSQMSESKSHRLHGVPTLSELCTNILDECEKKFISEWKKKYNVSSYSPKDVSKTECSSYLDPDKYSNISFPSTSAARSDIYEPDWDCRLNFTGDSLSENSFNNGVDSYSLDQPSVTICKKTGPWVSPAPVRRDFFGFAKSAPAVATMEQETSTASFFSDISTQTGGMDSYYEMVNISGNLRPVKTRTVSTSPIHELLMADMSLEDNKSQNSSNLEQSSPQVVVKPRYSSSPITNLPNLDSSEDILGTDDTQKQMKNRTNHPSYQPGTRSKHCSRSQSNASAQKNSFRCPERNVVKSQTLRENMLNHNRSKVERSKTWSYLSEVAQSLAEKRKKRFAFKHLFVKHDNVPVQLLSFKKLPDGSQDGDIDSDDYLQYSQSVELKMKKRVFKSPVKSTKTQQTDCNVMEAFFPNEDFSTNDTFFNRSLEENLEKDGQPHKYEHFGKWKVSYENNKQHFDFQTLDSEEQKNQFCDRYDRFIGCRGDEKASLKLEDEKETGDVRKRLGHLETDIDAHCSGKLFHSSSSSEFEEPSVGIDKKGQYVLYQYPEDPLPADLKSMENVDIDDSGDIMEDGLSPDSLSFMASLTRDIKDYDFTGTPKLDDDNGSNLNAFLQEALKPLDELLSEDSDEEDPASYQLSPSRWQFSAFDYPSFVSFNEDDEMQMSECGVKDVYPEPDVVSEYDPVALEKITSDENLTVEEVVDDGESCPTPNTSENVDVRSLENLNDESQNEAAVETLDDWLKFNEAVSEYRVFNRTDRYPTFTFVSPHKINDSVQDDYSVKRFAGSCTRITPTKSASDTKSGEKNERIFYTPGPNIYKSPEPNTCDNTFVSVSEMSFNESRGCTPYFTDIETDMDDTIEDPILANTNNNDIVLSEDGLKSNMDLINDINNNRIDTAEDSFNDVDLDQILVAGVEEDEGDSVDV